MNGMKKLFDFDTNEIAKREKQKLRKQKIVDYLKTIPAFKLKEELRESGGHPKPAWGDGNSWRTYYLQECRRRGVKLLSSLGWPTDKQALYANIHTKCVETLFNIVTTQGYFVDRHTVSSQVWTIIEHWEPYDLTKVNL